MSHDVQAFLASRPPDAPGPCPLFERYGLCPYSINCRFAGSHLAADGSNVRREPVVPRVPAIPSLSRSSNDLPNSTFAYVVCAFVYVCVFLPR